MISLRTSLTALTLAAAVGVSLGACSSSSSGTSGSSSPVTSAATSAAGAGRASDLTSGARATIKTVSTCLTSHGADPSALVGVFSGSGALTSAQLDALRTASAACASTVPANLNDQASSLSSCLAQAGYHPTGANPLSRMFSLDLTNPAVDAALKTCVASNTAATGVSPSMSAS